MKYGDNALGGKSGIVQHIRDFQRFLSSHDYEDIKKEMKLVFRQKRDLGLIPGLKENVHPIEDFSDEIDFIFLIVNHDPASTILKGILDENLMQREDLGFDIKFCASNFMGYGLFKQNVFSIKEFKERFEKQIFCK